VNDELKDQLARAFGLGPDADVCGLVADLRAGKPVDPALLRKGCLALVEQLQEHHRPCLVTDERLRAALGAARLGLWEWNLTTGDISVDRNILGFLGHDGPEQIVRIENVMALVHEDDREEYARVTREALRGGAQTFEIRHRARHADGRWVWIETHGNVTERDASGRVLRMMGTNADITVRTQIERALSNTLRVMQALLETLPLPVVLRDAERRVTLVNAAWEQMIGVPREQAIGNFLASPSHAPVAAHRDTDDQVFATRKPLRYETTVQSRNGTTYNVLVAKTPLLAEDGSITGLASVVTDISDQ
jgi:PAS domain S-box-containing protein